ncbi:WXG100 family type VII secretion target [Actinomadura parmotrematis]|uniref:WXG100 family type VII secretion target n=1 Tax=Actinomadura parmotrematis TaxID=2864039 RepID=A0ABS7G0T2_9ACTN|nr:hypothetical protein [Actinomadura parmotrematis]MBW8485258.1 hypothetical protein [Actinomadura parmotrematis]
MAPNDPPPLSNQYNLTPEELKKVEYYTYGPNGPVTTTPVYTGNEYGDTYNQQHTGMTQAQWDALSPEDQKSLYVQYAGQDIKDPKDMDVPRSTPPDGKNFDPKAEKGYEVDPGELRALAKKMGQDLDGWMKHFGAVKGTSITTAAVTSTDAGSSFAKVTEEVKTNFDQQIGLISKAFNGLITKLNSTADAYEAAHHSTKKAVDTVPTSGGNVDA